MPTERPVILVIHSRPRLRKRLVEQVEEWCADSIEVIGIQLNELDTACRKSWFQRVVCVFFQPNMNQARIKAKVRGRNGRAGVEPLPEEHEFHQNLDEGIFHSLESEGKFEQRVEQSFFDWTPARLRLRLEGPHETVRAIRLRWFLLRHGIPYQWTPKEDRPDIAAKVEPGKSEFNPTVGNLYIELGLIKTPARSDRKYDLVIVGCGPAGLSAAISASANAGLSTLVIGGEYPGGNAVMSINLIENYLGFPGGVTGTKLLKLAVAQAARLKVDIRPNWTATRLRRDPVHSRRYLIDVKTGNGGAVASAALVLLACGRQSESIFTNPASPEALSEQQFTASGEVQYGMEKCDAATTTGNVVIIGGGDSAGQAALLLNACGAEVVTVAAKKVEMSYHLQAALHRNAGIDLKSPPLTVKKFIDNDGHLTHVQLSNGEKVPANKVFVLAGGKPATDWLNTEDEHEPEDFVNIQLDRGFIRTDAYLDPKGELMFATSAPGVFAAGDVRINAHGRVGQAVGQGVAAVASMERYLKDTWQEILKDEESQAWVLRKAIHDAKEAAS